MKKFEIETQLNKMLGKLFMHQKKNKRVMRFELKDTVIRVVTDIDDVVILNEDAEKILSDFLPIDEPLAIHQSRANLPTQKQSAIAQTVIGSSANELKDILMNNIKKVQENKDYIPQAIEVNNNVKSIIDLAKVEVELFKALKG